MRVSLVLLLLSPACLAHSALYDITGLMRQSTIGLLGGQALHVDGSSDPATRVVFEDLVPGANWEHSAVVRVETLLGMTVSQTPVLRPPANLENSLYLSGLRPLGVQDVGISLTDLNGRYAVSHPERFHALLINGEASRRHRNDFAFLYQTLTRVYGYRPENISIADHVHRDRSPDLDGDGKPDIRYGSSRADISSLLDLLSKALVPQDHLLIVLNAHGSRNGGESTILLPDGELKASELVSLTATLPTRHILTVAGTCYGGGFVRPVVSDGRPAAAAATNLELSWATDDMNFDEFLYWLTAAFAGQTHVGLEMNADLNKDGRISFQEAFAFAVNHDPQKESPLLESLMNSGDAMQMGLGF